MSKKARSLVFLGPSDGEKVLLCFKWGVLNYALECRLDGVQNHSRSRPYLCTRAFSDGVGWPSPLLHGREDFWVIIHFCCWVGILCVCFQVDIVLHMAHYKISNRVSHLFIFYLLVFDRIHDAVCLNKMSRASSRNIGPQEIQQYISLYTGYFLSLWSPNPSWVFAVKKLFFFLTIETSAIWSSSRVWQLNMLEFVFEWARIICLETLPNNMWWCWGCLTILFKVFWPWDSNIFWDFPAVVLAV